MKKEYFLKVNEYYNDWLGIAASFVGVDKAPDMVNDMYIELNKYADDRIILENERQKRS